MDKRKTNTKWAIKSIKEYIYKVYTINLTKDDRDFLNAIIQEVRSQAHAFGYEECFMEDDE